MTLLFPVLTFLGVCWATPQRNKNWVLNWHLDNPTNWLEGRIPCGGQTLKFPSSSNFPVLLRNSVSARGLELPQDGTLLLAEDSLLSLEERRSSGCPESLHWKGPSEEDWWNPLGWRDMEFGPEAVPHWHRVPCRCDRAIFPSLAQSSFRVQLSLPPITVAALQIGEKSYKLSDFSQLISSPANEGRFSGTSMPGYFPLNIDEAPGYCQTEAVQQCHSGSANDKICGFVKRESPQTDCLNPVLMKGFCCPQCGAQLRVACDGSVSSVLLSEIVSEVKRKPEASKVDIYYGVMDDGCIYAFFTSQTGSDYLLFVDVFKQAYLAGKSGKGVSALLVLASGPRSTRGGRSLFVGVLVALFAAAVLLLFIFLRSHNNRSAVSGAFQFVRLQAGRRLSMVGDFLEERRNSHVLVPSYTRDGGMRFVNPSFTQPSSASTAETPPTAGMGVANIMEKGPQDTYLINPMYDVFHRTTGEKAAAEGKKMEEVSLSVVMEEIEEMEENGSEMRGEEETKEEFLIRVADEEDGSIKEDENEGAKKEEEEEEGDEGATQSEASLSSEGRWFVENLLEE